ncbi:MAG: solute:sodium symporter family transporter, partial [Planctomycetota bacterium]
GVEPRTFALWAIVIAVGVVGSIYALFGGLRTVAVSDTLNGIGLLVGGLLITSFALVQLGDGGIGTGFERLWEDQRQRLNSVGGAESSVPFDTIFSGIFLLNLFYWTTNQQIIQRTFGASSLAEGQKGVLLTGLLKLLGPLYLVLPGMLAYSLFQGEDLKADLAYGRLVNTVLPAPLTGFFAAVMLGAILSSFNSALNSACTLFGLGIYQKFMNPGAGPKQVVRAGQAFGWVVAIAAVAVAPFLAQTTSIFAYLQKMNGMYFIPIFAVVLVGMLTNRVPPAAAKAALAVGFVAIAVGYFVPPFNKIVSAMHEFQFLGLVFAYLIVLMLVIGELYPSESEFVQADVGAVDMTPWRFARAAGLALIVIVLSVYAAFANFSVLELSS